MNQSKTIDYLLKVCWQNLVNRYNYIATQYGFTQATGHILVNIHREGTTVSQIANSTGVKTTSLSRILNNLESLDLIYREHSDTDKRSVKVYLTPQGIGKRKIAKKVVKEFNEYLENKLSAKEQSQLIKSLHHVNDLITHYSPTVSSDSEVTETDK